MTYRAEEPLPLARLAGLTPVYLLLCLPGVAVLLYWAICYVGRSWSVLTFPYGYDYGEAPELNRALAVAHLRPFYPFWNTPPYQMANYTPLYSVLNGLFVRYFGVQFQSGRAIAWVCGLLFCAGLAWLAWREGRTLLAPLVTVLLWFSSHYVWNWTALGREDELAMVCSLAGLVVIYEGIARPQARANLGAAERSKVALRRAGSITSVWLATGLFLGAIYTRQTTVEAATACAIYLLVRRPRLGLAFIAVFALSGTLIFVLINAATHGAFYLNIVTGNVNVFHWSRVMSLGHEFWKYYQAAAVLAGFYAVTQLLARRQQLVVLWLLVTFVVAITAGKDGAASNYLLLPWGATSLAAGLAVGRAQHWSAWLWHRQAPLLLVARPVALLLPVVAGFLLLLHAQLTFHLPYEGSFSRSTISLVADQGLNGLLRQGTDTAWYRRMLPGEPSPVDLEESYGLRYKPSLGTSARREQAAVDALVAAAPGDVFDEDMTHVLPAGKRIYIQPFEFAEEARLGQWNQAPFVAAIERGQFGLAVTTMPLTPTLRFERYTPQWAAAFAAHYCLVTRTSNYYVYRPCAGGA